MPKREDFEIVEQELGEPAAGQVVVRNAFMSVDPYMRGRMRLGWSPGDLLSGGAVGVVVASNNGTLPVGTWVNHSFGWREQALLDGRGLQVVDPALAPVSTYLGVLGMPGLTAWGGLLRIGAYKDGETVFVSAASGAVGSLVGQIVRIRGGVAIGSAGSEEKVRTLREVYGFHHAFNYRTEEPLAALRRAAPQGIDIYFENVGGPQLEAAITHMRPYGRIPICGLIANYNDSDTRTPGPRNLGETIYKRVTLRGFAVSEFAAEREEFVRTVAGWIREGKVRYHETVLDGIERAPDAFIGLFTGSNDGKMLVRLSAD
jgi:hypothetical protein